MPKKESKQKIYRVVLSKTFEYPSCTVSETSPLEDLHTKAVYDFLDKTSSGNYNEMDFDIKIEAELPFKIRSSNPLFKEDGVPVTHDGLRIAVKELAEHDLEAKFGKLDLDTNPDIYEFSPREVDANGDVIHEEEVYLKQEVEEYYEERMEYYNKILKKIVL